MGLLLRSLVTCLFVTYAHGLDFNFTSGNNTCIIMKMNAAFILSYGKEESKLAGPVVDPSKSRCSNGSDAVLTLKWKDSNDTMTITFTKGLHKVGMYLLYGFIPVEHFKNLNTTHLEMPSPRYELSTSNMSYKCETPQLLRFDKGMFNLNISVADVQIQAFDVENSSFSHSEECSEDSFTTDSPASETTTHQNQTTTSPKPTPQISIKFPNKSNACIILESAAIQLNINYMDKNKNPQTAKVNITKKSPLNIKGQCAVNDTGSAYIMVSWIYRHSNLSLRMDFIADEMAKLNKMAVHAELSQHDFPDLPVKTKIVNSNSSEELFETSTLTYYTCISSEEVKLDNTTTVLIDMIQVQAFGVKEAHFTGNGTECSQDMTTTENPTTNQTLTTENTTVTMTTSKQTTATSAPMSTTAPLHPTNNYTVTEDNITCVFLVAKIDITIPYTLTNGTNASVVISVPQDFQTDGKCKDENQTINPLTNELNIHFFNHSWELSFVFQTENSSSQLGDMPFKTYSVKSITLLYKMNPALFPGHQDNGTTSHFVSTNITAPLFQSKAYGSYKCNVESDVPLNGSIKLEISDLQYKAFNNDNSTAFGGELTECSGDNSDNNKTNSVVPIAVGAALAGLVVIVLIAYLIGRRRNRKGYESV